MLEPIIDPSKLPGHEQAAAFRVGALIATQAIAVYVEADRSGGPYASATDFDALPARMRLRILEACEGEFRRLRERLLKDSLAAGDPTMADLGESGS
jgi:hypothetical protein